MSVALTPESVFTRAISTWCTALRGTCTQLYPAWSESLTWQDICRSGTTETLNILLRSKTSVAAVSVASKRTLWACCRVFWSRSHWPGSCGTSRTWISLWTHPLQLAQLLPLLLWGYLEETRRVVLRHIVQCAMRMQMHVVRMQAM